MKNNPKLEKVLKKAQNGGLKSEARRAIREKLQETDCQSLAKDLEQTIEQGVEKRESGFIGKVKSAFRKDEEGNPPGASSA